MILCNSIWQAREDNKCDSRFQEIEQIIGEPLPQAAYQYEWWWTNEDPRTTTHVQCRAWQGAGYKAEVQLARRAATFTR